MKNFIKLAGIVCLVIVVGWYWSETLKPASYVDISGADF
jgi:hypothetical protein